MAFVGLRPAVAGFVCVPPWGEVGSEVAFADGSDAALTAAAVAGAIAEEPVADCGFGILSSQRSTAMMAVHPLFFNGNFSNCWSALVKV